MLIGVYACVQTVVFLTVKYIIPWTKISQLFDPSILRMDLNWSELLKVLQHRCVHSCRLLILQLRYMLYGLLDTLSELLKNQFTDARTKSYFCLERHVKYRQHKEANSQISTLFTKRLEYQILKNATQRQRWTVEGSYLGIAARINSILFAGAYGLKGHCVNPLTATLFNLNFYPLEVVSRWRDPQLQVGKNYSDLAKWRSTVFKYCWLMSNFIFVTHV